MYLNYKMGFFFFKYKKLFKCLLFYKVALEYFVRFFFESRNIVDKNLI